MLEQFETKSNWERYFADKIHIDDLETKWEKLYTYRNHVAHSKCIRKAEYQNALEIIEELQPAFDECLKVIGDVEITEAQSQAVEKVANATIGVPSYLRSKIDLSDFDDTLRLYQILDSCTLDENGKVIAINPILEDTKLLSRDESKFAFSNSLKTITYDLPAAVSIVRDEDGNMYLQGGENIL